jgi:hypothetical protein
MAPARSGTSASFGPAYVRPCWRNPIAVDGRSLDLGTPWSPILLAEQPVDRPGVTPAVPHPASTQPSPAGTAERVAAADEHGRGALARERVGVDRQIVDGQRTGVRGGIARHRWYSLGAATFSSSSP